MNIKRQKRDGTLAARLGPYSVSAAAALALAPASSAKITDITSFTITSGVSASPSVPSLAMPGTAESPAILGLKFGAGFSAKLVCSQDLVPLGGGGSSSFGRTADFKEVGIEPVGNLALAEVIGASRIPAGGAIKGLLFSAKHTRLAGYYDIFGSPARVSGAFAPPKNGAQTGFVGFKSDKNGHTYYGWLRVKVDGSASSAPDLVSLVPEDGVYGAYGLKSDDILAGETAVPEPSATSLSGLALLALGATGVREMRRRRAVVQRGQIEAK
jgi:hypothetical protein